MQAEEATTTQPHPAPRPAAPAEDLDPVRIVEAALFSAGRPIALDEIAENTGLGKTKTQSALKKLVAEYSARDTALEIGQAGDKWAMQLRTRYAPAAQKLAPMEIAPKLLKTLALIAYHQPLLQSQLRDMVGDKAYDHIRELHDRGLVKRRVHERSFLLMTSERFPEYFGIPSSDREEMKVFLAKKLGIEVPKTDGRGNKKLGSYGAQKAEPAAEAAGEGDAAADASAPADAPAPEATEPAPEPVVTSESAEGRSDPDRKE